MIEGRDQARGCSSRCRRGRPARDASVGVDRRRRPAASSTAPRAGTRSRRATAPGGFALVLLATAQPDRDRRPATRRRHRTRRRRRCRRTARRRARRSPARAAARPSAPRRTARTPRRDARAASHRSGSRGRPGRRARSPSPAPARRRTNASGPVKTSGRKQNTPVATSPMTISGTRAVRSASQPKIGSPTSRAAGHAAMTRPSSARSTPCSVK